MRKMSVIPLLLLLLLLLLVADGRLIGDDPSSSVDRTVGAAETCEQPYGFLPCSSSFMGSLFLSILYNLLLGLGSIFVSIGSNLFVKMIGSSIIRSNLFQLLGTIPHIVIILVSLLSGSKEAAQERAAMTMGSVGGSTLMTLTCLVGVSILYGRDEPSDATSIVDKSGSNKVELMDASAGDGVTTDVKTSYTALVMLIPLIPFLIILAAEAFGSSPVNRVLHLVALIVSVILLFGFILYQGFYPWIQLHVFECLMSKYANGKLPRLLSENGRPDTMNIQDLFNKINKDGSESVSAAELQVLLSAVKMEEGDLSTDRDVESILESFDLTNDGRINQEAFVRGMDKLLSEITEERLNRIKRSRSSDSQDNEQLQESLLASSSSANDSLNPRARYHWLNYLGATFLVILGTVLLCFFTEPLILTFLNYSKKTGNMTNFFASYCLIPFVTISQKLAPTYKNARNSISLTLSVLYNGVYMSNMVSLIVFLAPVYFLNLSVDVSAEVLVVVVTITLMTALIGFRTTFPRWLGAVTAFSYYIFMAFAYVLTCGLVWP